MPVLNVQDGHLDSETKMTDRVRVKVPFLMPWAVLEALGQTTGNQFHKALLATGNGSAPCSLEDFWREGLKQNWTRNHPVADLDESQRAWSSPITWHFDDVQTHRGSGGAQAFGIWSWSVSTTGATPDGRNITSCGLQTSLMVKVSQDRIANICAWVHRVLRSGVKPSRGPDNELLDAAGAGEAFCHRTSGSSLP